jgi:hypothetical protein
MKRATAIALGLALCFVFSALGLASGLSAAAPVSTPPIDLHALALQSAPHSAPVPINGIPAPTVRSHWYAGGVISPDIATFQARTVSTQLTVPAANISSETNQFYYVLMSVWDNTGSYDQIGMANAFGVWGFTYSFTDYCAQNYYFNPDLFSLTPGTTYTFTMSLSQGELSFFAYAGQSYVGGLTVVTDASTFNVSTAYSCGGSAYYDFTDYEEVYYTQQKTPDFAMAFAGTMANARTPKMVSFTSGAPARVHVAASRGAVTVANVPFELLYAGTSQGLVILPHTTRSYAFDVATVRLYGSPYLSSCSALTSGWALTGWSGALSPPFSSTMTLTIPAGTAAGTYLEYIYAYNSGATTPGCTGDYTFLTLELDLT